MFHSVERRMLQFVLAVFIASVSTVPLYSCDMTGGNYGGYGNSAMPAQQTGGFGGRFPQQGMMSQGLYNPWMMQPGIQQQQQQQGSCPSPSSFGASQPMNPQMMGGMFGGGNNVMGPTNNMMGWPGWQQPPMGNSMNQHQQGNNQMNTLMGGGNGAGYFGGRQRRAAEIVDIKDLVEILPDEPDQQFPTSGGYQTNQFIMQRPQAIPCQTNVQCGANKLCCPTAYGTKACMVPVTTNNNYNGGGYNNPYNTIFGSFGQQGANFMQPNFGQQPNYFGSPPRPNMFGSQGGAMNTMGGQGQNNF